LLDLATVLVSRHPAVDCAPSPQSPLQLELELELGLLCPRC